MHVGERVSILLFALSLSITPSDAAGDNDWPSGYVVYETPNLLTDGTAFLFLRWMLGRRTNLLERQTIWPI